MAALTSISSHDLWWAKQGWKYRKLLHRTSNILVYQYPMLHECKTNFNHDIGIELDDAFDFIACKTRLKDWQNKHINQVRFSACSLEPNVGPWCDWARTSLEQLRPTVILGEPLSEHWYAEIDLDWRTVVHSSKHFELGYRQTDGSIVWNQCLHLERNP